jgi:hypothetical protein
MEKFSLYELLSFIVPGFMVIFLVNLYAESVMGYKLIENISAINFFESMIYIIASLVVGILFHRLTFALINWKWYQKLVYPAVGEIVKKHGEIEPVLSDLEQNYKKMYPEKTIQFDEKYYDEIFDLAYYFLEVNDKIGQIKSFQSLYFFFRNMITLAMISFVVVLPLTIFGACIFPAFSICHSCYFLVALLISFLIFVEPARWLRKKMIVRLFRSYHVFIIHANNKITF